MNATRFLRALEFAASKHREQRRKDGKGTPYINHPITVARLLAEVGDVESEDILIAALLHDTIEDTATTAHELDALFGPLVRRLVEEVTDDKSLPKAQRKQLQIDHASQLSAAATLIKLADKIANVSDLSVAPPADWSLERIRDYLRWADAVVRNCPKINPALEAHFEQALQQAWQVVSPD